MLRSKSPPRLRCPRLEKHRCPLRRRMCLIATLHLEVFAYHAAVSKRSQLRQQDQPPRHTIMLQIPHLLRIKSNPLLTIPDHSIIRPRRLPELVAKIHILVRHSIPLIMRNNILEPKRQRRTLRPTRNNIPRHPALSKMVQTAKSARQHVGVQITRRSRDAKS